MGDPAAADLATEGVIFDLQRFSIHDGPGIRSTVFVKGCPLRCAWCHNPEGIDKAPQLAFTPSLCIGCRYCVEQCPNEGHVITESGHTLNRELCCSCFACAEGCYSRALEVMGRTTTVREVVEVLLKDRPFYEESDGGITVSGGEPLSQYAFTRALLTAAHAEGLHTCLETSGYGETDALVGLVPVVDLFLYDYKETDPALHVQHTGRSNAVILDNLRALDDAGAAIILRCPIIPGINDREDHYQAIVETVESLRHCQAVHLMGYHRLGTAKQTRLGIAETSLIFTPMSSKALEEIAARMRGKTAKSVIAY